MCESSGNVERHNDPRHRSHRPCRARSSAGWSHSATSGRNGPGRPSRKQAPAIWNRPARFNPVLCGQSLGHEAAPYRGVLTSAIGEIHNMHNSRFLNRSHYVFDHNRVTVPPMADPLPISAPYDMRCPIARTLDIIGERWTILILRDLVVGGPRKFQDFERSLAGISPNTPSARLNS